MAGILYVRMTNPEADCRQCGMGMGRKDNEVTVGWKIVTGATFVQGGICAAYAASQTAKHGTFAVAPTVFRGRLRQMEVVYPHGTTATPKTNYDMWICKGTSAGATRDDLAASAFYNVPIKAASQKGSQIKQFNPPIDISTDLCLMVCNTNTGATGVGVRGVKAGRVRLYFE